MLHPLLMPDGGLVFHDESPMVRIDACGRIEWTIDGIFHHAIEPGSDGNLWVSSTMPRSNLANVSAVFQENAITEVTPAGKIVRRDWLPDVFERSGLTGLWRGRPYYDDPFHLNDIQPVREAGPHWQRGDLLLSLRNLSMIALYRPSAGRILWYRQVPWTFQHDVNVLDGHRISVFDNNAQSGASAAYGVVASVDHIDTNNRLMIYDFDTDRVTAPFDAAFAMHKLKTVTQGRSLILPNGDVFVEETENGRVMRMTPSGALRWRYVAADAQGRRLRLGWSRYLDPATYGAAIQAAANARCA